MIPWNGQFIFYLRHFFFYYPAITGIDNTHPGTDGTDGVRVFFLLIAMDSALEILQYCNMALK